MAATRKRLKLQIGQLEQLAAKLAGQRDVALSMGREDLAGRVRTRAAGVHAQLAELRRQLTGLPAAEETPAVAGQRLLAKIDELLREFPD